jgi:class 3 adenylate cyclase/tetratricopeptide (TPR) repeat protein
VEELVGHIFLSHVEKDLAIMEQIAQGIETAGYKTWYFERDVFAGTSYLIQITNAIESCDAIVLIASPRACSSDQVTKEVVGAFERGKPFFPVLINMTPPELKECQPEWRHALGGTAMIMVKQENLSTAVEKILNGLKIKGINPDGTISPKSHTSPHTAQAPSSSTEGERKNVTVMFADISGFTAMSENMDQEVVADITNECFRDMGVCIGQHGGTIDKFIGHCIMVLFGSPKTLEDAPHRAIETALELSARLLKFNEDKHLPVPLSLHIGINTGPVITGMVGSDSKQDFTVMGYTVNLASQMEDAAETGSILVTENTYRLTEGYFDFEPVAELKIKDKELPVKAYKVIGPRRTITRIEACMVKGLSPFVGRVKELDLLMDRLEQTREGHGQVVGLVGEPGVGKSRLVRKFREPLPSEEYTVIEGGCIHYGDAIPYLPILDMLKDYFDIMENENESTTRQKIKDKVTSLSAQLFHVLTPLYEVLSLKVDDEEYVKLDARQRHDRVFEAIRMLLISESQRKPLIIIIEDLHWIDKTSEELLTYLISSFATTRILLILLFRPEYTPSWARKTYYCQVRLDQLTRKIMEDLVRGILRFGYVEPELIEFIANRTEGNPLFIEEMTYNLLENGSIKQEDERYLLSLKPSDKEVPATIQGIIAARLDRLEGTLKGIMQTASVIGREFAFRILQAAAILKDDLKISLLTLQDLEFIYEKNIFPELEYIFKHALTREVSYNSLLIKKRKETHERVARAIEEIYADRMEEFYEMLAYHYSLSENLHKAFQYLKLSGDKAVNNYANNEAVRFCREAIRALDKLPESLENKKDKLKIYLMMRAPLLFLSHPEGSLETLQNGEKIAHELADEEGLLQISGSISYYHTIAGNPSLGLEYAEKCFDSAEKLKDFGFMARSADQICTTYFFTGDVAKVVDIGRKAVHLLEDNHLEKDFFEMGFSLYSSICGWYGTALGWMGKIKEGTGVVEKGFRNACEVNDKYEMGFTQMMHSNIAYFAGYGDNTVSHAQKAIKIYEEAEISLGLETAWFMLGGGYHLCGEDEKAIGPAEKGLKLAKDFGMPFQISWCYLNLAIIFRASGDLRRTREYAEEAVRISHECNSKGCEGMARIILGLMEEDLTQVFTEEAQKQIRHGISILEDCKLKPLSAIGYLHIGEFLAITGRNKEALENVKKAETLYREMETTPESYWLRRTREALAKLG